jgi:phospholipase/carboxylesterase
MLENVIKEEIAGLESYVIKGDADAPYIILLHGYGANFQDLLPLFQEIKLPFSPTWVFPNAPLQVDIRYGPLMRTWFPWDPQILEDFSDPKLLSYCIQSCIQGINTAESQLQNFIKALKTPSSNIFIGGFSQGAILTTYLALRFPETFKGLIILSGALLFDKEMLNISTFDKSKLPFFQSHGTLDPLLTIAQAEALKEVLTDLGLTGKFLSFPGGHEIPQAVLHGVESFLQEQTSYDT